MSTKKSKGPLLYINQPFSRIPSNQNMQERFTNKQTQEPIEDEKVTENDTKQKISLAKQAQVQETEVKPEKTQTLSSVQRKEKQAQVQETEVKPEKIQTLSSVQQKEKQELVQETEVKPEKTQTLPSVKQKEKQRASSLNRVKPFKDMDTLERLDYLINFPKILPPVPCVFYTAEKNYQGYLIEYDHHQITIQIDDQTSKTIPIEELKKVLLIGIKR